MSGAMSNDDVPIEGLSEELNCNDETPSPFFTVCTSLQPPQPDLPMPWQVTTMDIDNGGSPWKLYLAFIDSGPTIVGRAQFNAGIFQAGTVKELVRDLEEIMQGAYLQEGDVASNVSTEQFTRS